MRIFGAARRLIDSRGGDGVGRSARRALGADLAVILIAAHHVAEREENAAKNQHEEEQADDVSALQHAVSPTAAISTHCHSYFREPPSACIQLLIISMGSGNTIVVFFSTPISVNVWR